MIGRRLTRTEKASGGTRASLLGSMAATALLCVGFAMGVAQHQDARATTTAIVDCGPGIPLVKCNPSLYSPLPGVTFPPAAAAMAVPTQDALTIEPCSQSFVSPVSLAALNAEFGDLSCFRLIGGHTWVLIGDGVPTVPGGAAFATNGSILAALDCAAGDSVCSDPIALHDVSMARAYIPPNPRGRLQLQAVEYNRFLTVSDGYCGVWTFDTVTRAWYSADEATRQALLSPSGAVAKVAGGPALSIAQAATLQPGGPSAQCQ
jgi:hypothetical protein